MADAATMQAPPLPVTTGATPVPTPAPVASQCVTIDSVYGVNVRSGPGTTFAQLGIAADKAQFPLVEENTNNTWYRIRMTDGTGDNTWVSADFAQLAACTN